MFFEKEVAEGEKEAIDLEIEDIVTSLYSYWEENVIYNLPAFFIVIIIWWQKYLLKALLTCSFRVC